MKVIGFLNSAAKAPTFNKYVRALHQGLKEGGYADGKNVKIEFKWADGDYTELDKLAVDLVSRHVDLIVATGGTVSAHAAMKATRTIPILFVSGSDPDKAGLLKHNNATGIHVFTTESVSKRVALLRQLAPKAGKVAVLLRPGTHVFDREKEEAKKEGLIVVLAHDEGEIDKAFAEAVDKGSDALLVCANPYFTSRHKKIVAAANRYKIPTAYPLREYAEDGGLMSFGPSLSDAYRQIGAYAGMILKGIRPHALHVHKAKGDDFELVVNRKTAKALKLVIPKEWQKQGLELI
jgi:putative ABC transport system substrate-binding protein